MGESNLPNSRAFCFFAEWVTTSICLVARRLCLVFGRIASWVWAKLLQALCVQRLFVCLGFSKFHNIWAVYSIQALPVGCVLLHVGPVIRLVGGWQLGLGLGKAKGIGLETRETF